MSQKVRIELDSKGIRAMMNSDEMVRVLQQYADNAEDRIPGTKTSMRRGKTRANIEYEANGWVDRNGGEDEDAD